jgi:hypothetical protein
MRISTKVIIDLTTGVVIERDSYEYSGPLAECVSGGGSKQKSKSQSEQTSESGVKYNADFLNQARQFASGQSSYDQSPENFDAAAYVKAHPEVAQSNDYKGDPYQHWAQVGQNDKTGKYAFTPKAGVTDPTYNPQYTPGAYTGAQFTSVAPGGFDKLENSLYGTQQSKLKQAYDQSVAQQREELAQSGALNSPSQYLEGSARSSMDRSYLSNLQQAARDAFQGRLGAETTEAGRKTAFDVGQGASRTAFDTGEATRQTAFNEQTQQALLDSWMKKIALAIESGRYSQGSGTSYGTSSGMSGQGGIASSSGGGSSGTESTGAASLLSLFM